MTNTTTDISNPNAPKKTTDDARQGQRKKGMPSVLVISVALVSIAFAAMLATVLS